MTEVDEAGVGVDVGAGVEVGLGVVDTTGGVVAGTETGVGAGMIGSGRLTEIARGIMGMLSPRLTNAAFSTANTGAA